MTALECAAEDSDALPTARYFFAVTDAQMLTNCKT